MKKQDLKKLIKEEIQKILNEDEYTLNKILDKISSLGVDSLLPKEKRFLDQHSKEEFSSKNSLSKNNLYFRT